MSKRKLAPQNGFGTLTFGDGRTMRVKDERLAQAFAYNQQQREQIEAELADYRACYGPVKAALMKLESHWWTRLGRSLRLVPQRHVASDGPITRREVQRVLDMAPQREKAERERGALRVTGGATDGDRLP